jgi:hypothetical protein
MHARLFRNRNSQRSRGMERHLRAHLLFPVLSRADAWPEFGCRWLHHKRLWGGARKGMFWCSLMVSHGRRRSIPIVEIQGLMSRVGDSSRLSWTCRVSYRFALACKSSSGGSVRSFPGLTVPHFEQPTADCPLARGGLNAEPPEAEINPYRSQCPRREK